MPKATAPNTSPPAPDAAPPLPTVRSPTDVRAMSRAWKAEGLRVGFVPTMGALHAGHLALVEEARRWSDRVIGSVFVNPAQFAPHEDFNAYPRREAQDAAVLASARCDALYAPPRAAMYADGFATAISVGGPAEGLESVSRPHFFGGVALVVTKLLLQVEPDFAIFGEKDYQQLLVIRRLVADLDLPVSIVAGKTVRDADGLALSSRNAYLSPDARRIAGRLNGILAEAARHVRDGLVPARAEAEATRGLLAAGFQDVDYVAVRDAETLGPPEPGRPARILAAARVAGVRLIDNMAV